MATIKEKINACDYVIANMLTEQERIIHRNEAKIINLNKNQFIDGFGSNNKPLFNTLRGFDGVYSPNYKKQGLYDFFETGLFIREMYVYVLPNQTSIFIDSSGKGTGEKSLFFAGYTNLFGLDSRSEEILNYEIILPELRKWIKKFL